MKCPRCESEDIVLIALVQSTNQYQMVDEYYDPEAIRRGRDGFIAKSSRFECNACRRWQAPFPSYETVKPLPPKEVLEFVRAMKANAIEAWGESDPIAKDVVHVEELTSGDWQVSDNYERFFSTIYTFNPAVREWTTRTMYSEGAERLYTHDKCMADAACMFTG